MRDYNVKNLLGALRKQLTMKARVSFYREKAMTFRTELKKALFAKKVFIQRCISSIKEDAKMKVFTDIFKNKRRMTEIRRFLQYVLESRRSAFLANIVSI